jgi:hypothetical protein
MQIVYIRFPTGGLYCPKTGQPLIDGAASIVGSPPSLQGLWESNNLSHPVLTELFAEDWRYFLRENTDDGKSSINEETLEAFLSSYPLSNWIVFCLEHFSETESSRKTWLVVDIGD